MTCLAERARDAGQMDLIFASMLSPHQRLTIIDQAPPVDADDFASIVAQEVAKRALEIAAVANHPLQFVGQCDEIAALIAAGRKVGARQCFHACDAAPTPLDLNVEVRPASDVDLRFPPPAESSAEIRSRVEAARPRLARWPKPRDDDEATWSDGLDDPARNLLENAIKALRLDDRAVARVWLVARSIAALADAQGIGRIHIAEALSYARPITPPQAPEPAPHPNRRRCCEPLRPTARARRTRRPRHLPAQTTRADLRYGDTPMTLTTPHAQAKIRLTVNHEHIAKVMRARRALGVHEAVRRAA